VRAAVGKNPNRSKQIQRLLAIAEAHRPSVEKAANAPSQQEIKRDLLEMARATDYPGFTSLGDDLFAKESNPVRSCELVVNWAMSGWSPCSQTASHLLRICFPSVQYFLLNEVGVITYLAAHKVFSPSDANTLLVCHV
jgi:hypothetical protein